MMQDNDYNIIKPVEHLQNVGAMTPIDRQSEKRRRQNQREHRSSAVNRQDSMDAREDEIIGPGSSQAGQDSVDYRA